MNSIAFNLLTLLAAISNILLGLLVLLKNWKNKINISFFIFSVVSSVWAISNFIFFYGFNSLFNFKIVYATGAPVPLLLIAWYLFLLKKEPNKYIIYSLYVLSVIVFFLPFIGNAVISNLSVSGSNLSFTTGPLFNFFGFLVMGPVLLLLYLSTSSYLKARGVRKLQLLFILLGVVFYSIIAILVGVILPALKITPAVPFDAQSSMILVAFSAYSIVKHKFLDIRMVVARSVAYLLLIATLAGIYAGAVLGLERIFFPSNANNFSLAEGAMRTVIAVVMVFIFQPLRTWINRATDAIFFKNRYDIEDVLNELSHTMSSSIILVEMLYKVNDVLINNLKLSRSAFVIFKNDHEAYTSQAIGYKGWPPIDVPDFTHMAKRGILIYDELEEGSTYKRLLKKYDASVFAPVRLEGELIGIYLAGEKNSGDMFNQQDIEVFDTMTPEVAIAVQNAKSYEEISRFNVTLRQEVKRATRRLKDKNEQLKELDKAKDEFISMASHQLRTPLTAIKGYLSMLLEGDAGEIKVSQYDFINEAYSAAGRMVGLINDLLNVSRMETGRFFLEPKEVDIEKMVGEEVKQLQNHAKEKNLYLKIEKKGKIPTIMADETKIRQVVMNFIDNAIYYTQKGGVTVKLKKDKDEFVFEVHDTGIGVPKEQMRHLFEKFFRADNARQTRPDGTGLGIYLAKRVVEDHGGKIIFESAEGKGSNFGFRFPLKKRVFTDTSTHEPAPHSAPALTSASATFNEKSVGIEPPITVGTTSEK